MHVGERRDPTGRAVPASGLGVEGQAVEVASFVLHTIRQPFEERRPFA